MPGPDHAGGRAAAAPYRATLGTLAVVAACLLLIGAGGGVAAATHGNQQHACPGENENVGLENADPRGAANSLEGIGTAFTALECEGQWPPDL